MLLTLMTFSTEESLLPSIREPIPATTLSHACTTKISQSRKAFFFGSSKTTAKKVFGLTNEPYDPNEYDTDLCMEVFPIVDTGPCPATAFFNDLNTFTNNAQKFFHVTAVTPSSEGLLPFKVPHNVVLEVQYQQWPMHKGLLFGYLKFFDYGWRTAEIEQIRAAEKHAKKPGYATTCINGEWHQFIPEVAVAEGDGDGDSDEEGPPPEAPSLLSHNPSIPFKDESYAWSPRYLKDGVYFTLEEGVAAPCWPGGDKNYTLHINFYALDY